MINEGDTVQAAAATSTVCIVGFPAEAHPRELQNLCRFIKGFEQAHVAPAAAGKAPTLFVKFRTAEDAQTCIEVVSGVPFDLEVPHFVMRAQLAKREMSVRDTPPRTGYPMGYPSAKGGFGGKGAYGNMAALGMPMGAMGIGMPMGVGYGAMPPFAQPTGKGAKFVAQAGMPIDTIAVMAMKEKALTEEKLHAFFSECQGFTTLQVNERIGGAFIKFDSVVNADQALRHGNAHGFGAEWARRNMM